MTTKSRWRRVGLKSGPTNVRDDRYEVLHTSSSGTFYGIYDHLDDSCTSVASCDTLHIDRWIRPPGQDYGRLVFHRMRDAKAWLDANRP